MVWEASADRRQSRFSAPSPCVGRCACAVSDDGVVQRVDDGCG